MPIRVLNVGSDELDNWSKHIVLEQQANLNQAAATGEVNAPFFFSIVLVIDLNVRDAFEKEVDQEIFIR